MPSDPIVVDAQPVLVRGMAEQAYHAIDRCSNSRLSRLHARSPAHLRYELDNPPPPPSCVSRSDPLAFGSLLHALVLTPCENADAYAPMPSFRTDRGGTSHKEKAAWLDENTGKLPVEADAWDAANAMCRQILRHRKASAIIEEAADMELATLFNDRWHGEPCKLRADAVCPRFRVAADIKTTEDASPDAFAKSVSRWGYHRQAAFYLNGLATAGVALDYFAFIVVEKSPPHAVAVYQLDHEAIEQGEREVINLIEQYQKCRLANRWPGYQDDGEASIPTIDLPRWHYVQWENGAAA